MKLNKEELAIGAGFGASFVFFIGWWAYLLALACAYLWAVGGSGAGRAWRYLGVPAAVFVTLCIVPVPPGPRLYVGLALASSAAAALTLTIGYGIPTRTPPDEGSVLGRFAHYLAAGITFPSVFLSPGELRLRVERRATLLARGIIATLLAAAYCPLFTVDPRGYVAFIAASIALHLVAVRFVEGEITL